MSKKSNPTVIGAFVVGAVVLLAVGVSLFGGAQLFAPKSMVVAYFEGSVKGLRVGSNVLFRGVRIGFVSDIQLLGDAESLEPIVRTTLQLSDGVWILYRDGQRLSPDAVDMISGEELVDAGLRARLGVESFVTGQLVVELDFYPDSKPVLRALVPETEAWTEIPTIPSTVAQIVGKFQDFVSQIDFDRLQENLQGTLEGLNELANNQDARDALAGLNSLANNDKLQQLPANLEAALADVRGAAQSFDQLAQDLDTEIGPIATELKSALQNMDGALESARSALDTLERQVGGDTGLEFELTTALREVRDAARSLRALTDYLQKNPEALLRGKRER
ncbi:MAG: MCE family protein [Chromatiales bacterium]|nr:MAG: MCE family protein [Chromatiales bacterium]